MAAQPGERARRTRTFSCKRCGHTVRVLKGQRLPSCSCGGGEYDESGGEPGHPAAT